jgi:hypothetical protein
MSKLDPLRDSLKTRIIASRKKRTSDFNDAAVGQSPSDICRRFELEANFDGGQWV